jgi:hypothetical protein
VHDAWKKPGDCWAHREGARPEYKPRRLIADSEDVAERVTGRAIEAELLAAKSHVLFNQSPMRLTAHRHEINSAQQLIAASWRSLRTTFSRLDRDVATRAPLANPRPRPCDHRRHEALRQTPCEATAAH